MGLKKMIYSNLMSVCVCVCVCVCVSTYDFSVISLFPTVALTKKTLRRKIHSLFLLEYTVSPAIKVMCKCCGRVSGCDSNHHSKSF